MHVVVWAIFFRPTSNKNRRHQLVHWPKHRYDSRGKERYGRLGVFSCLFCCLVLHLEDLVVRAGKREILLVLFFFQILHVWVSDCVGPTRVLILGDLLSNIPTPGHDLTRVHNSQARSIELRSQDVYVQCLRYIQVA
jgi:hypothetical protein